MKYESQYFNTKGRVIVGHDSVGSEVGGTHYYHAAWFTTPVHGVRIAYELVFEDEVVEDYYDCRYP